MALENLEWINLAGFCEKKHNERAGFAKCCEYLYWVRNFQLVEKD